MDLQAYLRALRKGWLLVLIVVLLGGVAGAGYAALQKPVYESKVTFYVSVPPTGNTNPQAASQFAMDRANSYVALLSSEKLASIIVRHANVGLSPKQVMSKVSGTTEVNTVIIDATVRDTSRSRSLVIATALADNFGTMVSGLDDSGTTKVAVQVVSGPTSSAKPVSPRKKLDLILGLAAGVLLGIGAAVARELLNTTMRSVESVETTAQLPLIGSIKADGSAKSAPLVVGGQSRSARAEGYRKLRTNLQFINIDDPARVLVVTSAVAGEGKSTTSVNLAVVFAETGKRVLLIEADLRKPAVSELLGLERSVGLTNVLAGQVSVDEVLQPWGDEGMMVLSCGTIPPNPSELVGSRNMGELLATMRSRFDIVILDTPPLLPVTDAAVTAALSDGVVVVVRYGKTKRAQLETALRGLPTVDLHLLGCVLNMTPAKGAEDEGGYRQPGGYGTSSVAMPGIFEEEFASHTEQDVAGADHRVTAVRSDGRSD